MKSLTRFAAELRLGQRSTFSLKRCLRALPALSSRAWGPLV
jgi:hypothetical protein